MNALLKLLIQLNDEEAFHLETQKKRIRLETKNEVQSRDYLSLNNRFARMSAKKERLDPQVGALQADVNALRQRYTVARQRVSEWETFWNTYFPGQQGIWVAEGLEPGLENPS